MHFDLILPAFLAGLLTFLAPCTLPLVPGYIAFLAGVSRGKDATQYRYHILRNAFFYVLGFSVVFISLGIIFGLGGQLLAPYRNHLLQLGGVLIVCFGLYLLGVFDRIHFISGARSIFQLKNISGGSSMGSFLLGGSFALVWTPCVGPILGTVLLFAASSATALYGAMLLGVFSLGLAIPFLLIAFALDKGERVVQRITPYLGTISKVGGVLMVVLGLVVLIQGNYGWWNYYFYKLFWFVNYDGIIDFL